MPRGSSPRVRGTFCFAPQLFVVMRFIPACAGNIKPRRQDYKTQPVHPRVCGEHTHPVFLIKFIYGSSPRVRGT